MCFVAIFNTVYEREKKGIMGRRKSKATTGRAVVFGSTTLEVSEYIQIVLYEMLKGLL